jgi:hypothetical protein
MSMYDSDIESLIVELTKEVVETEAPEELPLFDELVQDFFNNPEPPLQKEEDDPLAFGVGETVVALTPVFTAMVTAVVTPLLKDAAAAAKEGGMEALKEYVKGALTPDKDEEEKDEQAEQEVPAPSKTENLEQIRDEAMMVAIEWGIKPKKARKMANDLVGRLAISAA